MDPPIEFHEDEYLYSPLSDESLRLIALFVDRETYDKLLYRGNAYARLDNVVHNHDRKPMETWSNDNSHRNGYTGVPENEVCSKVFAAATTVLSREEKPAGAES